MKKFLKWWKSVKDFLPYITIFPRPYSMYDLYKELYGAAFANSLVGKTESEIDAIFLKMDFDYAIEQFEKERNETNLL